MNLIQTFLIVLRTYSDLSVMLRTINVKSSSSSWDDTYLERMSSNMGRLSVRTYYLRWLKLWTYTMSWSMSFDSCVTYNLPITLHLIAFFDDEDTYMIRGHHEGIIYRMIGRENISSLSYTRKWSSNSWFDRKIFWKRSISSFLRG